MIAINRRVFLTQSCASIAVFGIGLATPALALSTPRIGIQCAHTGRYCQLFTDGTNLSGTDAKLFENVSRDWRTGQKHTMDIQLLRILIGIRQKSGSDENFTLISGYRSKKTNRSIKGTAKNSYHLVGRALDLRRSDLTTSELFEIATSLRAGGVGFYPQAHNKFVHVDTGPVRTW